MSSLLDIATNAVQGLQPTLALLKYMWDEIDKVDINRNKCRSLAMRATRILSVINDLLRSPPTSPLPSDVERNLERVER